jgi:NADH-quinone oxidoreductase subunit H
LWAWTQFLPSALFIAFGLYLIADGLRYETIWGRLALPVMGAILIGLAAVFLLVPPVNVFIQGPFWFLGKVFVFLFVYVWVRGTLPRFRYDQLMAIGWKLLFPVSLANVVLTSLAIVLRGK